LAFFVVRLLACGEAVGLAVPRVGAQADGMSRTAPNKISDTNLLRFNLFVLLIIYLPHDDPSEYQKRILICCALDWE
jgi:hypothetical protein